MPTIPCPICRAEMTPAGEDELDQSGTTFLPARRLACPRCAAAVVLATGEPPRARKEGKP